MEVELSFIGLLKAQPSWILLLSSLGFISFLRAFIAFLKWLYTNFLRPGKDLTECYGSWAVITGATDGIGKAFAFQLAGKGLHLVLLGRNPSKLKQVTEDVEAMYKDTKIKTVVVDLAGDYVSEGIRRLEEAIQGLDVGILLNNAGTTHRHAAYFHEVEEEIWKGIVRVNVEGTTRVARAVLPGMVERRRGAIVNMGSGASVVVPSFPFYAIYAATKGYIDQFSRSISVEYKSMGIDVQCQIPLYVATKMIRMKRSSAFIPCPDGYAQAAVRWIGYEPRCTPYWLHSIEWFIASLIPDYIHSAWRLYDGISRREQAKASKLE